MDKQEFVLRRQELMNIVGDGGIALLPSAPEAIRNRDVHYPYRPDSDFYYLTGFPEPEALMVLIPGRAQGEFLLFCRERNPEQETWHGRRAGLEGACDKYGADDAFPITDIDDIVPGLMESRRRVYYPMGCYPEFDTHVMAWMNQLRQAARRGVNPPEEVIALDHVLHEMRLFKSKAEITAMRQAAAIAISGHLRAMRCCRPNGNEADVEAELLYEFARLGSKSTAYPSIIGGGANGCILHYTENNARLNAGDLLLIDAGAEFDYYASDITRTFPVNGTFNSAQKEVYEWVLAAQLAAIEQVRPDRHWNDPHDAAVRVLSEGLLAMGILQGNIETVIKEEQYKRFYMHRTGHWLGMDVHDVGDYKIDEQWRLLEAGMVLTVEPGLYIPAGSRGVDPKYWNIGIRIEDDVLVTAQGHEVLTAAMPKTIDAIEAVMATGQS
ncbi:Xaa-Pro aminopeptidase [Thioflexithrix psekupsensis]|uniref:Xaa-Pro aminopeptidase n=1 Tax=Thioflexithrix psekupsensis TaxID=1570016 RepID=A0A251XBZ0_9GAMM|nr:Xaa-Pro aminopeptidase [Thioflexithrix psekupsensis]OUD16032.1 Xaa-Pro aminopeptidase [Thioflexithrix psekupsensis]